MGTSPGHLGLLQKFPFILNLKSLLLIHDRGFNFMKHPQRKAEATYVQQENQAEALECQAHRGGQRSHKEHCDPVRSHAHFPIVREPKPS